jgi:hypothetical protein
MKVKHLLLGMAFFSAMVGFSNKSYSQYADMWRFTFAAEGHYWAYIPESEADEDMNLEEGTMSITNPMYGGRFGFEFAFGESRKNLFGFALGYPNIFTVAWTWRFSTARFQPSLGFDLSFGPTTAIVPRASLDIYLSNSFFIVGRAGYYIGASGLNGVQFMFGLGFNVANKK